MRLLTHNTLRNNSAAAKGKGFPLRITAAEVKVDGNAAPLDEQRAAFLKGIIPTLDWPALVQVRWFLLLLFVFLLLSNISRRSWFFKVLTKLLFISRYDFRLFDRQPKKWVSPRCLLC